MKRIAVWPAAAAHSRADFLTALSSLFEIEIIPLNSISNSPRDLDALISFDRYKDIAESDWSAIPILNFDGDPDRTTLGRVTFCDASRVDPTLRGQTVRGEFSTRTLASLPEFASLATGEATPVWRQNLRCLRHEYAAVDICELSPGETLRERLVPGRCFGLIVLIHFLRGVCGRAWSAPPPRATIIIDDPNLRWRTYGHIRFGELVRHASTFNYHVAFAQIPLDSAFFHRPTAELFRSARSRVSLTIHGNSHLSRELDSLGSAWDADRLLVQALRRTSRFERKSGIAVSRVMVPPHEACSETVMAEMAKLGFEAVALTSVDRVGRAVTNDSSRVVPSLTNGFGRADVTRSGMPVLIRRPLSAESEVALRAFLDQPIILYGHESDFRHGLGFLEVAAAAVNSVPGVMWSDLTALCGANYLWREEGAELRIQAFTRRARIVVQPGIRRIVVEPLTEPTAGESPVERLSPGQVRVADSTETHIDLETRTEPFELEIEFVARGKLNPQDLRTPQLRVAPVLRRVLTESRDRSHPLRRRFFNAVQARS